MTSKMAMMKKIRNQKSNCYCDCEAMKRDIKYFKDTWCETLMCILTDPFLYSKDEMLSIIERLYMDIEGLLNED